MGLEAPAQAFVHVIVVCERGDDIQGGDYCMWAVTVVNRDKYDIPSTFERSRKGLVQGEPETRERERETITPRDTRNTVSLPDYHSEPELQYAPGHGGRALPATLTVFRSGPADVLKQATEERRSGVEREERESRAARAHPRTGRAGNSEYRNRKSVDHTQIQ